MTPIRRILLSALVFLSLSLLPFVLSSSASSSASASSASSPSSSSSSSSSSSPSPSLVFSYSSSPSSLDPVFEQNFSAENLLVVSASTLIWFALHVGAHYLSGSIFRAVYEGLGPAKQPFWLIRMVSTVHATFVSIWSLHLLFFAHVDTAGGLHGDLLHGATWASNLLTGVSAGYFLYDVLGCLYYFEEFGVGFTLHGFLCFVVYFLGLRPFLQGFAPVFLLFELSTPFLNVNWFLDKFGLTGSLWQMLNGVCLVAAFSGSRIVYGYYKSYEFWGLFMTHVDQIPPALFWFYGVANVLLNGLNTMWFFQMIDALRRRFVKKPKATKKKD